jgi:murein DD-endopeptidase MepM/ murein hydrolase activator NlpD
MTTLSRRTLLRLLLAVGMVLAAPLAWTTQGLAQELVPGATAMVANTGGEPVLLRDAPDWNAATITAYGEGTPLQIAEGPLYDANGSAWLGVVIEGAYGYLPAGYLVADIAPAEQPVATSTELAAPMPAQGVSDVTATSLPVAMADLNFRVDPSNDSAILWVIPAGTPLELTGDWVDAFAGVVVDGQFGWIDGGYLGDGGAPAPAPDAVPDVQILQEAVPLAEPSADTGAEELLATTLSDVNLREAPDANAMVLGVLPAGSELAALAGPELGYWQVTDGVMTGWVDAEYVQITVDFMQRGKKKRDRSRDNGTNTSAPADAPSGGGIAWPVSGGTWSIMQGYNGSSHQNQDDLWQYYYSLDIVREDGRTAGATVYSPVNGTVTWTDRSSGGISIDIGDGHAVAMFHVDFDKRFEAGTVVSQGEPMGVISGSGGPGFAGSPHLHFTLWKSKDDGNWDRHAVPFTGRYAIEGMDFPDKGGRSQYAGTAFNP